MAYQTYAQCQDCYQPIEWALNPSTGRRVPINALSETSQKDPRATWAAWDNPDGGYFARPLSRLEPLDFEREHPAINHVAFCPVPQHRRRAVSRRRGSSRMGART